MKLWMIKPSLKLASFKLLNEKFVSFSYVDDSISRFISLNKQLESAVQQFQSQTFEESSSTEFVDLLIRSQSIVGIYVNNLSETFTILFKRRFRNLK